MGWARLGDVPGRSRGESRTHQEIVAFLEANKYQGLTIDFEEVPDESQRDLQRFLRDFGGLCPASIVFVLAVPFDDDSWPYATLCRHRRLHAADGL